MKSAREKMEEKRLLERAENAEKAAPFLTLRREQLAEERRLDDEAKAEAERQAARAREAAEAARVAAAAKAEEARLAREEAAAKAKEEAEAAAARAEAERLRAEMKRKREEHIEQLKKEALEAHYAELKAREDMPKHPRWRQLTRQAQKFLEGSYEPRTDILKRMDEPSFLEDTERAARGT